MSDYPELKTFTTRIDVTGLDAEGQTRDLAADEADCAAIAQFLEIPGVKRLSGTVQISRRRDLVRTKGTVKAELVRQCVATLEDVDERIEEPFEAIYTTAEPEPETREEVQADLDAPEPIGGDTLDLAHVLLEQLVLAMDPHPRREGVEAIEDPGAGARISPFDVLKDLKSEK